MIGVDGSIGAVSLRLGRQPKHQQAAHQAAQRGKDEEDQTRQRTRRCGEERKLAQRSGRPVSRHPVEKPMLGVPEQVVKPCCSKAGDHSDYRAQNQQCPKIYEVAA